MSNMHTPTTSVVAARKSETITTDAKIASMVAALTTRNMVLREVQAMLPLVRAQRDAAIAQAEFDAVFGGASR
jgi:hypothetical protein